MPTISASDVMRLRNETGLPMMACKSALVEAEGDVQAAQDILRKQLKGKMEKRSQRAAGEGRIAVSTGAGGAAIVELRAETDFTAKNEGFVKAAQKIADLARDQKGDGPVEPTSDMEALVENIGMTTGENCSIARAARLDGAGGAVFGSYVHHDGKTGVLIKATGDIPADTLRQVCMHIAAAHPRPLGITREDISPELVEKERAFRLEQAMESGKPKEIAEKMVEGGMRKFYEEVALLEQPFVVSPDKKVSDIVQGGTIERFYRWSVGEE